MGCGPIYKCGTAGWAVPFKYKYMYKLDVQDNVPRVGRVGRTGRAYALYTYKIIYKYTYKQKYKFYYIL